MVVLSQCRTGLGATTGSVFVLGVLIIRRRSLNRVQKKQKVVLENF